MMDLRTCKFGWYGNKFTIFLSCTELCNIINKTEKSWKINVHLAQFSQIKTSD